MDDTRAETARTSRRIPGHVPVPRYRHWTGPAILSQGFRPFFMLAGLWSAGALVVWLHALFGMIEIPTAFDPLTWHVHEMLFGFVAATVAGFLLTAIPNCTGRLRSEERRVGNACVSTGRSRWSPDH